MQQVKKGPGIISRRQRATEDAHRISFRALTILGIGGIIGGGFFLGSGLPIRMAGPAVLLSYIVGGLITAQVLGALTSIAVTHPVKGSFTVYSRTYLGPFVGFVHGWVYYVSSILAVTSESVAMGIFVQHWFPRLPISAAAAVFCTIIVVLNAFGLRNFERIESFMSIIKISALVGFIVYTGILVISAWRGGSLDNLPGGRSPGAAWGWMPHGFSGLMQAMLIVIFAYSGIGMFATAASEIRNPRKIDRAAMWTVVVLTTLYCGSIGLLLCMEPWNLIDTNSSPFVSALERSNLPWLSSVFNGIILIAAFSVMAGSLYAANQILFSLGKHGEAPGFVTKQTPKGTAVGAFLTTVGCIAVALGISVVLPANLYNFLVSASSFFTFFNWLVILSTFLVWRRTGEEDKFTSALVFGKPVSTYVTMGLLLVLAGYALTQPDQRLGFYASITIMVVISLVYLVTVRRSVR